ncbi:hypothetical protein UFOVP116_165 [uncultured Caudovirales phage]|uniref:Uncharacterized protein n=1 Tax=uncultured Caudovirales phage TaxID=2100421 RepID=A0A6J5L683_9CAUD|nr:hypothetical protein UFOVP116_165 [uncultured Caudovirales phage]
MLGYPKDSKPIIQWKHIDGPLLICSNGLVHWLTIFEQLMLMVGATSIEKLNRTIIKKNEQKN